MCVTSRWFSTKRHMRLIYYKLKWIIPATLELNCWECCWVFEVFVELWPESLAFSALVTNSPLSSNPINSKDASLILASSVCKDSIRLAAPPRIVHDSKWADTCSIYFDIWDLQTGSWMKFFIDHSLNVGNMVCFFRKASIKIGAPLYTRCYSWGHNTNYCNFSHMVCPICDGSHCALATCCKGHLKQVPPVPPTINGEPCPHLALCKNWGKPHAANSPCCQFWQHHFNRFWIVERYAKTDVLWSHAHPLTGETGDMTPTWLGVILHDSVESSVIHSLILKHFETFYYNLMQLKDYTRVMEKPWSDNYASEDVMCNIRSWIQNGTTWARLYTWSIIPYNAHRVRQHQGDFKPFYSNTFIFFIF